MKSTRRSSSEQSKKRLEFVVVGIVSRFQLGEELVAAANDGNLTKVEDLLLRGVSINYRESVRSHLQLTAAAVVVCMVLLSLSRKERTRP